MSRGRTRPHCTSALYRQRNANLLVAIGWQGYQAHGPGAILIDADRAIPDPQWEGGITPGLYISHGMLKGKGLDWPNPDIKRMVWETIGAGHLAVFSDSNYNHTKWVSRLHLLLHPSA